MPLRHRKCIIDQSGPWYGAGCRANAALIEGATVGVFGPRGTGKTQIGVECINQAIVDTQHGEWERATERGYPHTQTPASDIARYTTALGLFLDLRTAMKSEHGEGDALKRFTNPRLLVIDEIQERGETPWEDRILTSIIDSRYASMRKTLLVGNLEPAKIAAHLGSSIVDRMRECGAIIACEWPSFRRKINGVPA